MSTRDYEAFKGVTHYGNNHLTNILETNLKDYMDWAMLKIGGWTEVANTQTGLYGADHSQLRSVEDPSYTNGQVWEGVRKDWVWESGVDYSDVDENTQNPLQVGTPTVNGTPTVDSYHVNYPLGRIVFDTAISTSSTVKVAHSYRNVQTYIADDAPWFNELQMRSYRPDDSQFDQTGSGEWSLGGQHRVQLPAIVIEAVPRGTTTPYELGNGSLTIHQDVLFHIVAERRWDRNNLVDIIRQQSDKAIWLYDTNRAIAATGLPLDYRGERINGNNYPDLILPIASGGYRWNRCYWNNATVSEVDTLSPTLYEGVVRTSMEIVLGGM
jgi:hypothetical protein